MSYKSNLESLEKLDEIEKRFRSYNIEDESLEKAINDLREKYETEMMESGDYPRM